MERPEAAGGLLHSWRHLMMERKEAALGRGSQPRGEGKEEGNWKATGRQAQTTHKRKKQPGKK